MPLRTAEEIIKEYTPSREYPTYYHESKITDMIKAAQENAIEEAAEAAKVKTEYVPASENEIQYVVDKDSILNLKKQIQ